jgi:hypothetical protein
LQLEILISLSCTSTESCMEFMHLLFPAVHLDFWNVDRTAKQCVAVSCFCVETMVVRCLAIRKLIGAVHCVEHLWHEKSHSEQPPSRSSNTKFSPESEHEDHDPSSC